MSSVALMMLVKDELQNAKHIITNALPYFDQITITVSDKTTANKLKKEFTPHPHVDIDWRAWTDDFAAARNHNMSKVKCDYAYWQDADDAFDFRHIPQLVEIMDNGVDALFLPYNYAQDEDGNCVVRHWRERMVRLSVPFEWRGRVHESMISDTPYISHKENIEVKHIGGDPMKSLERNHKILEKAVEETNDPRYVMYLGMSYFTKREYAKAAETLVDYLGFDNDNDEDVYRSLCLISESAWNLKAHNDAKEYALKAIEVIPEYPMGYWLMGQYEVSLGKLESGLEWLKTSETKPDPETLAVWDPTSRDRSKLLMATTLFELGRHNEALAVLKRVKNPALVDDLYNHFVDEADKETFINLLPRIRKFYKSDEELFNSLSSDLKYDVRLKALRNKVTKPKKWGDKSLVIFCGQGYEEWGPHTLDKGMGGSEEAVVYLSRELARLGWVVTVYAEAEGYDDDTFTSEPRPPIELEGKRTKVMWRPWQEIDTRDEFNVFVSWRSPQFAEKVKAKVKIVDLHDVVPAEIVKDQDATYFVKSQYHRDLYKHLPDEKFVVVGNGIRKEQFKKDEETSN